MLEIVRNVSASLSHPASLAAAAMIVGGVMLIVVGGAYITHNTVLAVALFAVVGNFGVLTGMAYLGSPSTSFGFDLYHVVPVAEWAVFIALIVLGFVVLCCSDYEMSDSEAAENTLTRPITLADVRAATALVVPAVRSFGGVAAAMGTRRLAATAGSH